MDVNAIAIIQARIRSERLYEKSVLPLCGKPMLMHIIERAAAIEGISKVIVATGDRTANRKIAGITGDSAEVFFGDEFDVLSRYYLAASPHKPDYVVRVTGDNPFTDVGLASVALSKAVAAAADLASVSDTPLGTAVEIIHFEALREAFENASTDYQHEHVTPYIKEHPGHFTIQRFDPPENLKRPSIRLTVDTAEDFSLAKIVYERLYQGSYFPLSQVLQLLDEEPQLLQINGGIQQRPMTHSQQRNNRG